MTPENSKKARESRRKVGQVACLACKDTRVVNRWQGKPRSYGVSGTYMGARLDAGPCNECRFDYPDTEGLE